MMKDVQKAEWIWYPGDYEIFLGSKTAFRRYRRNVIFPPSWRIDYPYKCVHFYKKIKLLKEEEVFIKGAGEVQVMLTGRPYPLAECGKNVYKFPEGEYAAIVSVYNKDGLPALYADGAVRTDNSWLVSENMVYGYSVTAYSVKAGCAGLSDPDILPGEGLFRYETLAPVSEQTVGDKTLYDFGRETFGYVRLEGVVGSGRVTFFYGESREEALDEEFCEVYDVVEVKGEKAVRLEGSRAMRYLSVRCDGCRYDKLYFIYEYLPVEPKSEFFTSDKKINEIYKVALYTLHLNAREVFLDGIKRDRWPWCGDAYQAILMNFYSFYDKAIDERTLTFLLGKEPFNMHINHITDYTFYWFIALYEHYMHFGDREYIRSIYGRTKKLMDFVFETCAESGFIEYADRSWCFVDWGSFSHDGALCVEQILFHKALTAMEYFARLLHDGEGEKIYGRRARALLKKIFDVFWDEERGIFMHSCVGGKVTGEMTRYANVFALLYGYVKGEKKKRVVQALKGKELPPIITPYAKMYELAALSEAGECEFVMKSIRSYWGDMLDKGATTFWELYDPESDDMFSMYGRKYGKSFCHAWGASPLYIFGKYILGVSPVKEGYAEYIVKPAFSGLEEVKGSVPVIDGKIDIEIAHGRIKIYADTDKKGTLVWKNKKTEIPCRKEIIL